MTGQGRTRVGWGPGNVNGGRRTTPVRGGVGGGGLRGSVVTRGDTGEESVGEDQGRGFTG